MKKVEVIPVVICVLGTVHSEKNVSVQSGELTANTNHTGPRVWEIHFIFTDFALCINYKAACTFTASCRSLPSCVRNNAKTMATKF